MNEVPAAPESIGSERNTGVTLLELIVSLAIIAILSSLALVGVQNLRESSRRTECSNRLRQVTLATQLHIDRNRHYPYAMLPDLTDAEHPTSTDVGYAAQLATDLGLSDAMISAPSAISGTFLPDPFPAATAFGGSSSLICPSDGAVRGISYRGMIGDSMYPQPFTVVGGEKLGGNGVYRVSGPPRRPADIRRGLSQTMIYAERLIGSTFASGHEDARDFEIRDLWPTTISNIPFEQAVKIIEQSPYERLERDGGGVWYFTGLGYSLVSAVMTPNHSTPDAFFIDPRLHQDPHFGLVSARSHHPGQVQVAFCDGSLSSIGDSINQELYRKSATVSR